MAATAPTATMDTTGWCRDCQGHSHKLCEHPECRCTLGSHPKRRHITEPPEDPLADVRARASRVAERAAEPAGSAAAEVCGSCRRSQHTNCTRATCTCPFERHPKRRAAASGPEEAKPPAKAAAKLREPVWQLVKADPPAPPPPKPKRLTVVERARPFVEQLVAEGDRDWHRFAIFPSSMAAAQTKGRVAKAYPEFVFKAVRVAEIGQSALYGRWTGKRPSGQL